MKKACLQHVDTGSDSEISISLPLWHSLQNVMDFHCLFMDVAIRLLAVKTGRGVYTKRAVSCLRRSGSQSASAREDATPTFPQAERAFSPLRMRSALFPALFFFAPKHSSLRETIVSIPLDFYISLLCVRVEFQVWANYKHSTWVTAKLILCKADCGIMSYV